MIPSGTESHFCGSASPEQLVWHWRCLDASGADVTSEDAPRFPSQGDAETWVGEVWRDLKADGVESVVLLELEREVYGPMSLSA